MTNEEAIQRLKEGAPFSALWNERWEEALSIAIEALENEPIRCKDCKYYGGKMNYQHPYMECTRHHCLSASTDFCSKAERKGEEE